MADDQAAAVAALFAAGIILVNLGVGMAQAGDTYNGIAVAVFGVALIFAAVFVAKIMVTGIARREAQGASEREKPLKL